VLIVAPLLWRRRRPVTVAAAVLGALAIQSAVLGLDTFPIFDIAALVSAAYAVGAHAERRLVVAGLLVVALGSALHAVAFHPDAVAPAVLGGATVPWVVGRTVRSRRLLASELQEKSARMEHARELEVQAAMTTERMRVARELHDVVAHNISVIAIQAGGAEGIVARDPERAAQCAALIEAVGREALLELSRLLDPLNRGDAGLTAPKPSLARVTALAQRARAAGLPVELRVEGEPAPLPAGVDLAAYRIVQEALANTSKHAGAARAWVVVRYGQHGVEVEIADDGRGPNGTRADTGSGHGLVGMRERVGLYGGTLNVGGGPSGGFLVRARLPVART
jgi:signal transduction histidine kinase